MFCQTNSSITRLLAKFIFRFANSPKIIFLYKSNTNFVLKVVVHEGRRVLIDTVSRQILESVDERLALQRFMSWLYTVKGNHAGVVLISHSTIKLDVPVLLQSLSRHKLEAKFFEVVSIQHIFNIKNT